MAVTSEYQPIRLKGIGSTARFDFTFRILAPTDLQVYVGNTLKELGTHYDVKSDIHLPGDSGYDWRDGGYVQFNIDEIPAENVDVTIHRVIPVLQLLDLEEGGSLPPEVLETAFDRITYIAQQISNAINRCLSFPVYAEYDFDPTVPEPKAYAVLGVSADGKSFYMYDEYVLKIQYSPNLEDWYDESVPERNDRYVRISVDGGQTWGSPVDMNGLQSAALAETKAYRDEAVEAAAVAQDSAARAFGAAAPAWSAEEVYSFPDVVAYVNGHTYRCKGTGVDASNPPVLNGEDNEEYWTRLTLSPVGVIPKTFFEYDDNGDLMPI
jgi:hypothetical protein